MRLQFNQHVAGISPSLAGMFLAALLPLLVISCHAPASREARPRPSPQVFTVKGVVREIKPDGRTAVIRHEEIPGYMEAMTMPFRARGTNELSAVKPGDEITFRLLVTEDESWIDQVTQTGRVVAQEPAPASTASPTNAPREFRLSDIPDFALTNEFGRPLSLHGFNGRAVAMTFFFTRCPIPEYCPRLTKNFQGAIERLKAAPGGPTNYHFLSISFDPVDTPVLLRSYARQYRYDSNHWSFVTGNNEQIQELARGFGVAITKTGAAYDHNFSTAIFDTTGRLQNMWPIGGDVTDQIVAEVTKAARP
jgi:protein SCO1/2